MYALWIQCNETKCILRNDDDFLSLLKSEVLEHFVGKGFVKEDRMIRFVNSASCLEDLELIVESFINNSAPYLCRFTWTIVKVDLP